MDKTQCQDCRGWFTPKKDGTIRKHKCLAPVPGQVQAKYASKCLVCNTDMQRTEAVVEDGPYYVHPKCASDPNPTPLTTYLNDPAPEMEATYTSDRPGAPVEEYDPLDAFLGPRPIPDIPPTIVNQSVVDRMNQHGHLLDPAVIEETDLDLVDLYQREWGPVHDKGKPNDDHDRDQWGRYKLLGQGWQRASTFAKTLHETFALDQWGNRNVVLGMASSPDLCAAARGKDIKADAKLLNAIAEDAKNRAGHKTKADLGTAYHFFAEYLDTGVKDLKDIPEKYVDRLAEYREQMTTWGLQCRPEWVERTVVSTKLGSAGTLDRIILCPDGKLRIGDLKTGDNAIKYGEMEIAIQECVYALGANENGLFNWNTRQFEPLDQKIELDFAIVMHLPAGGVGCEMQYVPMDTALYFAERAVQTREDRKSGKGFFRPLTPADFEHDGPCGEDDCPHAECIVEREYQSRLVDLGSEWAIADSRKALAGLWEDLKANDWIRDHDRDTLVQYGQNRAAQM